MDLVLLPSLVPVDGSQNLDYLQHTPQNVTDIFTLTLFSCEMPGTTDEISGNNVFAHYEVNLHFIHSYFPCQIQKNTRLIDKNMRHNT